MSNKKPLQVQVAELCGWHNTHTLEVSGCDVWYGWHPEKHPMHAKSYEHPLPRYTEDLNAMHEAEECLGDAFDDYCLYLQGITPGEDNYSLVAPLSFWDLVHADARQRAEAFVKAMEVDDV